PRIDPRMDHLQQLPRGVVRSAERPGLARFDDLLHRAQRRLERAGMVRLVEVVELDAIGPEPAQALLEGGGDPFRRQTLRVADLPDADLGGDARLRPALAERAPQDPLRFAIHVDVRGIEEHEPALEGTLDDAVRLRLRRALAEVHRAHYQRRGRSFASRVEVSVHGRSLCGEDLLLQQMLTLATPGRSPRSNLPAPRARWRREPARRRSRCARVPRR